MSEKRQQAITPEDGQHIKQSCADTSRANALTANSHRDFHIRAMLPLRQMHHRYVQRNRVHPGSQ